MSDSAKLSKWINKIIPGGRTLRLVHEQLAGMTPMVVAAWPRDEVDALRDNENSIGALIVEAAREHADSVGESCRFAVQWINAEGEIIRAIFHREMPTELPQAEGALAAGFVSGNQIVGQLMQHIGQQQKVVNGGFQIVMSSYERTMNMQQRLIEQQNQTIAQMREQQAENALAQVDPSTEHLNTVKANAFAKLAELGPDVLSLIIAKVADHYAGQPQAAAPKSLSNGASAPQSS
jgi:hypothetical protein